LRPVIGHVLAPVVAFLRKSGHLRRRGSRVRIPGTPSKPFPPVALYPVLTEEYAAKIARDWNAKQKEDKRGYVTRFRVRTSYLRGFEPQLAGGQAYQE
jgi:hypothetical protein